MACPVVAEGVERREELDTLHRLGCRQFQGYLFSRPIPAGQFPEAVRTLVTEIADPGFAMAPSR